MPHKWYWVDVYRNDSGQQIKVLEQLKVIFSENSPYRIKVLVDDKFAAVFEQKLGKRRMPSLKQLLLQIDKEKYSRVFKG
jgi:hypothetical protein